MCQYKGVISIQIGHAHADIDALFGNFGKWLCMHNALTVPSISFTFIMFHCYIIFLQLCYKVAGNVIKVLNFADL